WESAEALLLLAEMVRHRGLWGVGKDFDGGCYVLTTSRSYQPPAPEDIDLPADIYYGPTGRTDWASHWNNPTRVVAIPDRRENFWWCNWYTTLIGSVRDGFVTSDTEGIPDLTAERKAQERRGRMKREREMARRQLPTQLELGV
ncbi:MAG: hypothetical protein ACLFVA_05610, partial [Dehalococcoidia bacterium]